MNNTFSSIRNNDSFLKVFGEQPIEKAIKGEGSRGGKIIGHTKSGKTIYADKKHDHKTYSDFTPEEHLEAADYHKWEAPLVQSSSPKNDIAKNKHHISISLGHVKHAEEVTGKEADLQTNGRYRLYKRKGLTHPQSVKKHEELNSNFNTAKRQLEAAEKQPKNTPAGRQEIEAAEKRVAEARRELKKHTVQHHTTHKQFLDTDDDVLNRQLKRELNVKEDDD
jgi:DNA-binding transcriptional MerR regulator